MPKFRKKPMVVEAMQFTGRNYREVLDWMGSKWPRDSNAQAGAYGNGSGEDFTSIGLWIATLEGKMDALPNDWVIKGVKGEFYPCKPDIFAATYEAVY